MLLFFIINIPALREKRASEEKFNNTEENKLKWEPFTVATGRQVPLFPETRMLTALLTGWLAA